MFGGRNFVTEEFDYSRTIMTDISGKRTDNLSSFSKMSVLEIAAMRHSARFGSKNWIVTDDEWSPFKAKSFDGAISCLNAHWIEDLKSKLYPIFPCQYF